MEAIILAGGFGSRLKSVVNEVPKPMAPVQNRPFLEFIFAHLKNYNVKKVILSVGYLHNIIIDNYGNNYEGIDIEYAIEDQPLGTGGAIKLSLSKIADKEALIINGDSLFNINIDTFSAFFHQSDANVLLALKQIDDVSRYGCVTIDDNNKITAFHEKGKISSNGIINGGIYLVRKNILDNYPDKFSFEKDFLEKNINNSIFGLTFDDDFIDIGIPEDYLKIQTWNLNYIK